MTLAPRLLMNVTLTVAGGQGLRPTDRGLHKGLALSLFRMSRVLRRVMEVTGPIPSRGTPSIPAVAPPWFSEGVRGAGDEKSKDGEKYFEDTRRSFVGWG